MFNKNIVNVSNNFRFFVMPCEVKKQKSLETSGKCGKVQKPSAATLKYPV
jgi:hypothetical protein